MPSRVGYQPIIQGENEAGPTTANVVQYGRQNSNPNDAFHPTTFFPDQVFVQIGADDNRRPRQQNVKINTANPQDGEAYQSSSTPAASKWSHIDNLDDFFTRVYEYHQRHGFLCMLLSDCFELFQFVFVLAFTSFLFECVDYRILFKEANPKNYNATQTPPRKITLADAVRPECASHFPGWLIVCLILAAAFWFHRLVRVTYRTTQSWEMRQFFMDVLKIPDAELENLTWHEVQRRLRDAQHEHHLCIHKRELSELDIYQRILRRKNYMVAFVNKGLLPPKCDVPFLNKAGFCFFTNFFKLNLELLFFASPWSAWENYWHLKADYKRREKRQEIIERTRRVILYMGLANLVLSPLIFVWQILYSFFFYAELAKREPGSLGARRWSIYGRYYFRHFNELDHELDARLCRAYKPAQYYMDMFISSVGEIFAKNVAFFAGALFAVLVILSVYDEDVLQIEHVLTIITGLGVVIAICKVFIPDENLVWCPEMMMNAILCHVHYVPDQWKGIAHTENVRSEFSQQFQYKATFLVEELLSPIVTPFVLIFWLRPRASEFVDFFRKFTVDVSGLGDVCSFAQMDVQKHGDPVWHPPAAAQGPPRNRDAPREPDDAHVQAEYGKTEMSLVHFAITNPDWEPSRNVGAQRFLDAYRREAQKDTQVLRDHQAAGVFDNPLLQSMGSIGLPPYSFFGGNLQTKFSTYGQPMAQGEILKGRGVSRSEGPLNASCGSSGVTASQQQSQHSQHPSLTSMFMSSRFASPQQETGGLPCALTESTAAEMSLTALYMHELHRRRMAGRSYGAIGSTLARTATREEEEEDQEMLPANDLWTVPQRPAESQAGDAEDGQQNRLVLRNADEDEAPPNFFQPS